MSTSLTLSAYEYLNRSFKPDVELVGGELKDKPVPSRLHGYVQSLICSWFLMHKTEWRVVAESAVRTEVRKDNFRLPDVSITRLGTLAGKTQNDPPLIAIEILSDDDRFLDLEHRASDLELMGVGHIWLIGPEERRAWVWTSRDRWVPALELRADDGVHLDLSWLWAEVSEHQGGD